MIQMICDILDINYEEIKDKLPKDEEEDAKQVEQKLDNIIPEDGGDIDE